jgi:hypothetical protein
MRKAVLLDGSTVVNVVTFDDAWDGDVWDGYPVEFVHGETAVAPGWVVDGDTFVDPNTDVPTYDELVAQVEDARRRAYQTQTDPLFFGWQRGENSEQDWLDAVQAVKDAHPYPEPS